MIDFYSTRPGVHPEDACCARLLTAIIAQAIWDTLRPLTATEKAGKATRSTMDQEALDALNFLFAKPSVFPLYAGLIGSDARDIRRALLEGNFKRGKDSPMRERDARIIRARLNWSRINYEEGLK